MITFHSGLFYLTTVAALLFARFGRHSQPKKNILFAVNIIFMTLFFFFRKKQFGILILSAYLFYLCLERLARAGRLRRRGAIAMLAGTVLFMGVFRYALLQSAVESIIPQFHYLLRPAVFFGLSFLGLRMIHLVADVYSGEIESVDLIHVFNFLFFFPTYVSGPLDRYQHFVAESEKTTDPDATDIYRAVYRIVVGAFKKTVLANQLIAFSIAEIHHDDLLKMNPLLILLSIYVYTFVLYFDFSGYCDIAIGIAQLFGIEVPENFNYPFLARNVQDFWQRWHITFMEWLKVYVYFPIGRALHGIGMSNAMAVAAVSFLLTFLLAGVWHGDGVHYLYYGLYHGIGFCVLLAYRQFLKAVLSPRAMQAYLESRIVRGVAILITAQFVAFSWFFYLDRMDGLRVILGR